jgi:hypothetical protein
MSKHVGVDREWELCCFSNPGNHFQESRGCEAAPEGKIRVLTTAWAEPMVILADQVLEVRIRRGQINILRKPRVEEAADHPPSGFEGAESNA